jgi:hypothetical protein
MTFGNAGTGGVPQAKRDGSPMSNSLFRKKSSERLSSPDQLDDRIPSDL